MCAAYLWAEQIDPEVAVGVGCEGGDVVVEMMMMMITIIVMVIISVIMVASLRNPHPGHIHNSSNDSSQR